MMCTAKNLFGMLESSGPRVGFQKNREYATASGFLKHEVQAHEFQIILWSEAPVQCIGGIGGYASDVTYIIGGKKHASSGACLGIEGIEMRKGRAEVHNGSATGSRGHKGLLIGCHLGIS